MVFLGNIHNGPLIYLGASGSKKVFTPTTEKECQGHREAIIINKKKNIKAAQNKLNTLSKPIHLVCKNEPGYPECNNNTIIIQNINSSNIKLIFDKNSKSKPIRELREDLRLGKRILIPGYIYNGEACLAAIPAEKWRKEDKKKCMDDYYGSGQYWKDISNFNLPDLAYNYILSTLDNAAKSSFDKIPNPAIRRSVYFSYGVFKTKILLWILQKNPVVATVSGGFYIASFACKIIFDFSGIIDLFTKGRWEDILEFLGSLTGGFVSGKGIIKTFKNLSNKKISIGQGGKVKISPLPAGMAGMAKQIESDTGKIVSGDPGTQPAQPPQRHKCIGPIRGHIRTQPDRQALAPAKTQESHPATKQAEQHQPRLSAEQDRKLSLQKLAIPGYNRLNEARIQKLAGNYNVALANYRSLAVYLLENPSAVNKAVFREAYEDLWSACQRGKINTTELQEFKQLLRQVARERKINIDDYFKIINQTERASGKTQGM